MKPQGRSNFQIYAVALMALCGLITSCSQRTAQPIILNTLASSGSAEPHLAVAPDGQVILSWLERKSSVTTLKFSALHGEQWQVARTVASGSNWFVNWADFPSVVPLSDDLWAAHWLVKSSGAAYSYDALVATSTDQGVSWSDSTTLHRDGTPTEHGFVSLYERNGKAGAVWLDGRNMSGTDHHESSHGGDGMTLRSAEVSHDGDISAEQVIDDFICDCCQTDTALTQEGLVAVYRNRTNAEVRDIYIARHLNGQWQAGQAVSDDEWVIDACPVNGPSVAAFGSTVAVAWFTAAQDQPRTMLAISRDNGKSFAPALTIDNEEPIGRVDIEVLNRTSIAVSWLDTSSNGTGKINMRHVSTDGHLGRTRIIATTDTARMSGFPQMVRSGDQLVFAWTDTSNDQTMVRSALLDISELELPHNP